MRPSQAATGTDLRAMTRETGWNFAGDAARWQAVVRRAREADGVFCYAVTTTGVDCRPSCASRRPRRENVRFYATCAAAEAAGFGPCKRCRPNALPAAPARCEAAKGAP